MFIFVWTDVDARCIVQKALSGADALGKIGAMTVTQEILATLARMKQLAAIAEDRKLGDALSEVGVQVQANPASGVSVILGWYAGMGSLSDVVLHRNAQPLIDENNEFDELRARLHEFAIRFRTES